MKVNCLIRALRSSLALILFFSSTSFGGSVVPQKSLRSLEGRQVWVPICSRRGINGSAAYFDDTNTAVMDQVACYAPNYGTVTAIRLVYAAFDMPQQGETDRAVTASGVASVFVPSANVVTVGLGEAVGDGAIVLPFSSTALGANGISLGQAVTSSNGFVPSGTYVAQLANNFSSGPGNTPILTSVSLSAGTLTSAVGGELVTFSGSLTPVKFGGKRQFLIEPAHDLITSDPIAVQLSPGEEYFVRTAATFSGVGLQLMDYPGSGSRLAGEFDNRSLTMNDQTMSAATLSNTGGGYWCPVAVLGLVTLLPGQATPGAVLILGDSIAAGTGDNADALGLQGYIQRSLENDVPFITAARGSTTVLDLIAHGDGQYALSIDTGITDVLLEDGRNDIESFNMSDSIVEAEIMSVAESYSSAGKRVWCFTIPPTTQSNDGWLTLANQSWTVAVDSVGSNSVAVGSTNLSMTSVVGIAIGEQVSGPGIAGGSAVVNISGLTIGISEPTVSIIPSNTPVSFGSLAGSNTETYRLNYNRFLRSSASQLGCTGVIDVDRVVSDQGGSGKWRVDLGAASADGVHPAAVLHQALVNSGEIAASMFVPP